MAINAGWKAAILSAIAFQYPLYPESEYWNENALEMALVEEEDEPLLAQSDEETPTPPAKPFPKLITTDLPQFNSRLQLGGNYTYLNFHPHGHQTFMGSLGGMQGLYEYMPSDFVYAGFKFAWRQGNTDNSDRNRFMLYLDGHERIGYNLSNGTWGVTPFTGLGFHYLKQKLHEEHFRHLTYKQFYVPLGMLINYNIYAWFTVCFNFTWMPQVFSTVSPFKGNHWTLINQMNNFHVEIPLAFTLTESYRFQIIAIPFYEHWEDGHSTTKHSGKFLPGNGYNYFGIDVNFAFNF